MPLQDSDIFLVTKADGSESRHIRADKLFSGIADDWLVLINEGGVSKRCLVSDLVAKATDARYMLVNQSSTSYKIKSSTVAQQYAELYPIITVPGYSSTESNPVENNTVEDQTLTIRAAYTSIAAGSTLKMIEPSVSTSAPAFYTPKTSEIISLDSLTNFEILGGPTTYWPNGLSQSPYTLRQMFYNEAFQASATRNKVNYGDNMNSVWPDAIGNTSGRGDKNPAFYSIKFDYPSFFTITRNYSSQAYYIFLYSNDGINYKLDNQTGAYQINRNTGSKTSIHIAKYWLFVGTHSSTDFSRGQDLYELALNQRWDDVWYHQQFFEPSGYRVANTAPIIANFDSPNPDLKYFQSNETVSTQRGNSFDILGTDVPSNSMAVEIGTNIRVGDVITSDNPKSGTGTATSDINVRDTSASVTNSNGQWIDVANREGREFAIQDSGIFLVTNAEVVETIEDSSY